MKKILVIAPYKYLPFDSGGQKFIARFVEHLANTQEVSVISVPENDNSLARNYSLFPLLKSGRSRYVDISLTGRLTEFIRAHGIETVIWEHPYYYWLARKLRRKTGVATVVHTHNIEYQRFRSLGKWWWRILRSYERNFFRMADAILFITSGDREFAVSAWDIPPEKCIDLPFGIDISSYPSDRHDCRRQLLERFDLSAETRLLFFNGLLNYKPNLDALQTILNRINPLLARSGLPYRILVAGSKLPAEYNELRAWNQKNVIYAGFTTEIDRYYKASDIFLNPVQSGGGIKTKLVEAIAYGCTAVSSRTGAAGLDPAICGEKLVITKDDDWEEFAARVIENVEKEIPTPSAYYQHYYWPFLAGRVSNQLP